MKTTACPLDCFDACRVFYKDGICKPSNDYITNKNLCKLFGYLINEQNLTDKNLANTLQTFVKRLKKAIANNEKILYYKGSGNMGVMNNITKKFFEQIKATFAVGSLCEASGEAGILLGRDAVVNPPIQTLKQCDIIVCWGRNFTKTSKHIYNLVKDKTFITIDPYCTDIAKQSKLFLQIVPKGDYILANLLQKALDDKQITKQECEELNITQDQLKKFIELTKNKKVAFMLGLGAQKYKQGASIFHTIEKFANNLGVFKNGGVWYLSNSGYPYNSKIYTKITNTTPYPSVDFGSYDLVFIQGANPVISAPNSSKIRVDLEKTNVVFFGTTFNDTAKYANIIIPAKTFLQKDDVRLSYGHDEVTFCNKCEDTKEAISEYELTNYLLKSFGFEQLLPQQEYFEDFKTIINQKPPINFKECKVEDVKLLDLEEDEYYLLTSKHNNNLNSQFKSDQYAYIHPSIGLEDDQEVILSSSYGTIKIKTKNDSNIHKKAILIYAGNKQVNILTSNNISDLGNNAIFQDIKVKLKYI